MEDAEGCVLGYPIEDDRQRLERVSCNQRRRVVDGEAYGRLELGRSAFMLRPNKSPQPQRRVRVGETYRIQVKADAERHGREAAWNRWTVTAANLGHYSHRGRPLAGDDTTSVLIGVTVPEQMQSGACADVHQRQRESLIFIGDSREGRQKIGAPAYLVGLHQTSGQQVPNGGLVGQAEIAEMRIGIANGARIACQAGIEG